PLGDLEFLRRRGVDLDGLEKVPGKTFRWRGRYGFDLNIAETLETQLNVFEHFSPRLGAQARRAERIFLGNIDPELQIRVLDQAERPRLVCADTMNYWINSRRAELLKLLPRVDVLMVNDSEVRQLAGESNVMKAAHAAQRMGVKSAISARMNAALVTSPNCRSGGKLETESAKKPAALIRVAKTMAWPETRKACARASPSGWPSRSCRWWKKWIWSFSVVPRTVVAMRMVATFR